LRYFINELDIPLLKGWVAECGGNSAALAGKEEVYLPA
jgi:hypothetical protein